MTSPLRTLSRQAVGGALLAVIVAAGPAAGQELDGTLKKTGRMP